MSENGLPASVEGCLVCHAEGDMLLAPTRRLLNMGAEEQTLTCEKCGSIATLDWHTGDDADDWRIKYRRVLHGDAYAQARFEHAGWLAAATALDISTQIYVHRQRLEQTQAGNLSWLKPQRLDPPPPLMNPEEIVYVTLKAVNYSKAMSGGFLGLSRENQVLDTGTFYITSAKIHMLGQRRDRSHRLTDILKVEHKKRDWLIYVDDEHYYESIHQEELLDGEMLIAIIEHLQSRIE